MKAQRLLPLLSICLLASCQGTGAPTPGGESTSTPSEAITTPAEGSPTTPQEPITPTVDLAKDSLEDLLSTDLLDYTYMVRKYQDSYLDGRIAENARQTLKGHSYVDAFEAEVTYEELSGVMEPETVSSSTGRMASYNLDETSYIYGLVSEMPSDNDFVQILELNRYSTVNQTEEMIYSTLIDSAITGFTDLDALYPTSYGYTLQDPAIVEEEDGFLITLLATAEESGYYAKEEQSVSVLLDKYSGAVKEISSFSFLYDMGYEGDSREEGANSYNVATLVIERTGTRTETEIEPLDTSSVPEGQIQSFVYEVPEVAAGDIPEDKVLEIFANIKAYTKGTNKDSFTVDTSALVDTTTFETMPPAKGVGEAILYEDDLYASTVDYTFEESSGLQPLTQVTTNEAEDDGIHSSSNGYESVIPPEYVTEWATYFTPGPFTATMGTGIYAVQEIAASGFGKTETEFSVSESELLEAKKEGNTITIHFTSSSVGMFSNSSYDITITIVDDFLTKYEVDNENGATEYSEASYTYEVHNLSKGDPLPREE